MKKIYICKIKEFEKKDYFIEWFEELKDEIIIFLDKNKKIKAFSSICPHFGGELIFDKKNEFLKCKWHNWKFDIESGACLTHKIPTKLKEYNIEIEPKKLKSYDIMSEDNNLYLVKND